MAAPDAVGRTFDRSSGAVYQARNRHCRVQEMADADLDAVIRSVAKKATREVNDAAKKRHGRLMGMAAKAKDKDAKARYRHLAKNTLELAAAAVRRLQITGENAADSYARAIRKAAEEAPATKPEEKPAKKAPVSKGPVRKKPARKKQG
jgi:hypothetical protein